MAPDPAPEMALCRQSQGLGDKGEGWQQTPGKAGAYRAFPVAHEKCWHLWGQCHCPPDSDDAGADVSELWVCYGEETGLSALVWGDRAPATSWLCKIHPKTVFNCKMHFFRVATIASPGINLKQLPKVSPPKRSVHFQHMLPAVSLLPTSQLQFKKGLQQCPLCPVVPVLDVLILKEVITIFGCG